MPRKIPNNVNQGDVPHRLSAHIPTSKGPIVTMATNQANRQANSRSKSHRIRTPNPCAESGQDYNVAVPWRQIHVRVLRTQDTQLKKIHSTSDHEATFGKNCRMKSFWS